MFSFGRTWEKERSHEALKVSVSFVATGDTSAGAAFTIEPVTFGLKGDLEAKAFHKVELSFRS